MAGSCLASRTAEMREPHCLLWQHSGTPASGDHQEFLVDDCLQHHLDSLTQPGNPPIATWSRGKKVIKYWGFTSYGPEINHLFLPIPKWGKKPAVEGICFSVSLKRNKSKYINYRYQVSQKTICKHELSDHMGCGLISLFMLYKSRLQIRAHLQSRFKCVSLLMSYAILASLEPLSACLIWRGGVMIIIPTL